MNRAVEIAGFLTQHGWETATAEPFEGDFSPRRYARLTHADGRRAVLMDADPDQKTPQFVMIDKLLRSLDLSAPEIYAAQPPHGLVLMEDFGDRNLGRLFDDSQPAEPLYRQAIKTLAHLHRHFDRAAANNSDLLLFNATLFTEQVELFLDSYFLYVKGVETTSAERESFRAAWQQVLRDIDALPQTLMLRDFMPDNLMLLREREGHRGIGLLDFQDGGIGPIAYDLASLCEVVRRDADPALLDKMIAAYYDEAQPSVPRADLNRACIILSAQRHMRILGIIIRLTRRGRRDKLACIPRIEVHLGQLLKHEALAPVKTWLQGCGFAF